MRSLLEAGGLVLLPLDVEYVLNPFCISALFGRRMRNVRRSGIVCMRSFSVAQFWSRDPRLDFVRRLWRAYRCFLFAAILRERLTGQGQYRRSGRRRCRGRGITLEPAVRTIPAGLASAVAAFATRIWFASG